MMSSVWLTSGFKVNENFLLVNAALLPKYVVFTDGQLTPSLTSETYSMPGALVVGDINNDHLDDVVVTYGDTYLTPQVYISKGDGTFSLMDYLPAEAARRHIRNAFLTDINNDGFLDYIGFSAPHGMYQEQLGSKWDFDEPDLIMINQKGHGFSVIEGLEESSHHGGHFGDLNNDGLTDIFGLPEWPSGANWSDPRVPLVQSDNNVFAYSKISLPAWFESYATSDIRIGDLNNDGYNDYVVTLAPKPQNLDGPIGTPMVSTNAGTIAYAYGKGTLDIDKLEWHKVGTHWMDQTAWDNFLALNYPNLPEGTSFSAGPSNVELADVNGDGLVDILVGLYVAAPFLWQTSGFTYLENAGHGFVDKTAETFPNQSANRDFEEPTSFILKFNLVDLNADGAKDLVLTHKSMDGKLTKESLPSFSVFMNQDGIFLPLESKALAFDLDHRPQFGLVSTGDVNGDGAPDLITIGDGIDQFNLNVLLNTAVSKHADGNTINGTPKDDVISLLAGDQARGMAGDDRIIGTENGLEQSVYYGAMSDFEIIVQSNRELSLVSTFGNEGNDKLVNIERLRFSDTNLALDIEKGEDAGSAYRIYKAAFDRAPDAGGLGFWISAMDDGASLTSVASGFINSPEFQKIYGANVSDRDYVTKLYNNVLDRNPDQGGYDFWLGAQANGATREDILVNFSESKENIANVADLIANGIQYQEWLG